MDAYPCSETQSPIVIDPPTTSSGNIVIVPAWIMPNALGIYRAYDPTTNGWHPEIDFDDTLPTTFYNGITYSLKSIHFHVPCEHEIPGRTFDGEAHFFHEATDGSGNMLVIAVFLNVVQPGQTPSASIQELLDIPTIPGSPGIFPIHWIPNYPLVGTVYLYQGSKTTGENAQGFCACPVQWVVIDTPLYIGADTFAMIKPAAPNNRATQGNRNKLYMYSWG